MAHREFPTATAGSLVPAGRLIFGRHPTYHERPISFYVQESVPDASNIKELILELGGTLRGRADADVILVNARGKQGIALAQRVSCKQTDEVLVLDACWPQRCAAAGKLLDDDGYNGCRVYGSEIPSVLPETASLLLAPQNFLAIPEGYVRPNGHIPRLVGMKGSAYYEYTPPGRVTSYRKRDGASVQMNALAELAGKEGPKLSNVFPLPELSTKFGSWMKLSGAREFADAHPAVKQVYGPLLWFPGEMPPAAVVAVKTAVVTFRKVHTLETRDLVFKRYIGVEDGKEVDWFCLFPLGKAVFKEGWTQGIASHFVRNIPPRYVGGTQNGKWCDTYAPGLEEIFATRDPELKRELAPLLDKALAERAPPVISALTTGRLGVHTQPRMTFRLTVNDVVIHRDFVTGLVQIKPLAQAVGIETHIRYNDCHPLIAGIAPMHLTGSQGSWCMLEDATKIAKGMLFYDYLKRFLDPSLQSDWIKEHPEFAAMLPDHLTVDGNGAKNDTHSSGASTGSQVGAYPVKPRKKPASREKPASKQASQSRLPTQSANGSGSRDSSEEPMLTLKPTRKRKLDADSDSDSDPEPDAAMTDDDAESVCETDNETDAICDADYKSDSTCVSLERGSAPTSKRQKTGSSARREIESPSAVPAARPRRATKQTARLADNGFAELNAYLDSLSD